MKTKNLHYLQWWNFTDVFAWVILLWRFTLLQKLNTLRSVRGIRTKISSYRDLKKNKTKNKTKQGSKISAGKVIWFQLAEATHHLTFTKDTSAYNKQGLQFDIRVVLKEQYITHEETTIFLHFLKF